MTKMPWKYNRELFHGRAPLSSLWAKIRIGYALAIFGPKTFSELEKLREIRNVFAHAAHPVTFQTKRIAQHCRALRLGNSVKLPPAFEGIYAPVIKLKSKKPRDQFLRCILVLIFMLDDAFYENRPKRPRNAYNDRYLS